MTSRLTVDIPEELHKIFKVEAIAEGVHIKTLVAEAMEFYLSKKPNRETLETFAKTDNGEDLHDILDVRQYFDNIKNQIKL
jgi:hypothetical protein